ncbi:SurA N-terminal domain-containing protein [Streptomyces sp. CA-111067]|uniref:SurA N-terminal domain-containing protein n=1 Tax=Streptomyces sp. CA-111067 TaxID=3240046 RepID=UPI003D98B1BD
MVRRRTAVSIAAAALLLASPALTACGSGPDRTGSAAVVGDQKISVAALQSQVNAVRTAQTKSPQAAQLLSESSTLSTQTLTMLVQDKVISQALSDARLTVSNGEVQAARAQAVQQYGSEAALDSDLLQNYGIAPSGIDSFLRTSLAAGKITQSLGFQPGSDGGQTAIVGAIAKKANELGVHINPRYGSWDAKTAVIGAAKDPWLLNRTPTAAQAQAQAPQGA